MVFHNADARASARLKTAVATVVAGLVACAFASAPAGAATSVTSVTATNASPTTAAGGLTTYTVGFTTSPSGALSQAAGSQISVVLATGTTVVHGGAVKVGASVVGFCNNPASGSTTVPCFLSGGQSIAANTAVVVTINGVTNPSPPGPYTLKVSTTSDTAPATSPSFSVTAAQGVAGLTATNASPTTATGGITTYTVGFTTSGTGALAQSAGSEIDVVLAAGTTVLHGGVVKVGASQVGSCNNPVSGSTTVPCFLGGGQTIAASTAVVVTINGVVNPSPPGSYTLKVSTTSDTTPMTSPSFSVTAAQGVSSPTATNASPTTAAGGITSYAVGFTTSTTGALAQTAGSEIDLVLAAGTTVAQGGVVKVGASQVGSCNNPVSGSTTVRCFLGGGQTIAAGTAVAITLNGVTNPSTPGSYTLSVSTTSDTTPMTSTSFSVTTAHGVSGVTATNSSPTTAANGLTTYTVGFTTSATGALAQTSGSEIDVVLATGTTVVHGGVVKVGASQVGSCNNPVTGSTVVRCFLGGGQTIAANTAVAIAINGVTNPSPPGSYTLKVSTTSDTTQMTSPSFSVTPAAALKTASIKLTSSLPSATNVVYTVTLGTSATGGLANVSGSEIDLTFPAGTKVLNGGVMKVGTTQVGSCNNPLTGSTVVRCFLGGGQTIAASTSVVTTVNGVTNPATTGPLTLKATTTSDTVVKSVVYCIVAAGVPCISKVAPGSGPVGTAVTITGLNLRSATSVAFNGTPASITTDTATKITTTVPTGATTGKITVTNAGGTAVSPKAFKVT